MKIKLTLLSLITLILATASRSQDVINYKWWNPANNEFPVIEGQAWPVEMKGTYLRLPQRAEKNVRKEIWDLAQDAAGLVISFNTNSPEIVVRYKVGGGISFPHMPSTGVSGVDLFGVGKDGNWLWCHGGYSFNDTITYKFNDIDASDSLYPFHKKGGEYRLYLPLYNNVTWMEIGTVEGSDFKPLPVPKDKPIVIYGTSIAQGGCASRPGMAWTSILGRDMDRHLINLGFSGNGLLEKELIDLISEVDAKIFVLDCLPNLAGAKLSPAEIKERILASVRSIRQKRKDTPILLAEHAGFTDALINPKNRKNVDDINNVLKEAFAELKKEGVKNIFTLSKEEIDLDFDSMVDGIHPNDLGMFRYAKAYEKKLRVVLKEPIGTYSTTKPITQNRDANTYDWKTRHNEVLSLNASNPPSIVFIGNSITHYWGGKPTAPISRGKDSWEKSIEPHNVRNAGFGWDRIENVLWRVYHDELDGFAAKQIVLLIGTNNLDYNNNLEILAGLKQLVTAVKSRQPNAQILLLGLIPREGKEPRIIQLNTSIAKLAKNEEVKYADPGKAFQNNKGKINESMFTGDGVHPNEEGYRQMAKVIGPLLIK